MNTRHSPILGSLAFYPIAGLAIVTALPEGLFIPPAGAGELWALVVNWWFALFVATVLAVSIFFSVDACRRASVRWWRRALWIVGFWLLGPIVLPAYWWVETHAT